MSKNILKTTSTTFVFTILLAIYYSFPLHAAVTLTDNDLIVTYQDPSVPKTADPNPGNPSDTGAVWSELNIYPGQSFSQTITVTNTNVSNNYSVAILATESTTTQNLADVLSVNLTRISDDEVLYSDSLNNLYTMGETSIDVINAGVSKDYLMTVTFNQEAGNEYQGAMTKYNQIIGFNGTVIGDSSTRNPGNVLPLTGITLSILVNPLALVIVGIFIRRKKKE